MASSLTHHCQVAVTQSNQRREGAFTLKAHLSSAVFCPVQIDAACARFKLDETVRNRLTNAMRGRAFTFKVRGGPLKSVPIGRRAASDGQEDMRTLNDVMRAAKHPKGPRLRLELGSLWLCCLQVPCS